MRVAQINGDVRAMWFYLWIYKALTDDIVSNVGRELTSFSDESPVEVWNKNGQDKMHHVFIHDIF